MKTVSRQDLIDYLNKNHFVALHGDSYSDFVRGAYNIIRRAALEDADEIVLQNDAVIRKSQGKTLGKTRIVVTDGSLSRVFQEAFERILNVDEIVSACLYVGSKETSKCIYRFRFDE